ncbi:DNA primase family protein [Reyranella soli]|nr:DNA primase family protein [Reyranella soli]
MADREQIARFVRRIFKHAAPGTFVSLRAFQQVKGAPPAKIIAIGLNGENSISNLIAEATRLADEMAKLAGGRVFAPPLCTLTNAKQAREADAAQGLVLTVDADQRPKAARGILEALLGPATIVVATGGVWQDPETGTTEDKLHLHWVLLSPTRDPTAHKILKDARRNAARLVGGDATAVPLVHPFRWPGSLHTKNPANPRMATIISETNNEVDLGEVAAKLVRAVGSLPLGAVEETEYNEASALADISAGTHYHRPTLYLLGLWARVRMPLDEALARLRLAFESTPADMRQKRGGDWQVSFEDLERQAKGIYAKEAAKRKEVILNPRAPLEIAQLFATRPGAIQLRHYLGSFYEWRGTHYEESHDSDIEAEIYAFLENAKRDRRQCVEPFNPERADVEKVLHALQSHVHLRSRLVPPVWVSDACASEPLVACANGLLRLSDEALLPHSADYFNTSSVDFAYDPAAEPPSVFLNFLEDLWGSDQESIETLQEMFGYILSGEQQHQKMFLLVGPPRSGKGTIGRILTNLVGKGGARRVDPGEPFEKLWSRTAYQQEAGRRS